MVSKLPVMCSKLHKRKGPHGVGPCSQNLTINGLVAKGLAVKGARSKGGLKAIGLVTLSLTAT